MIYTAVSDSDRTPQIFRWTQLPNEGSTCLRSASSSTSQLAPRPVTSPRWRHTSLNGSAVDGRRRQADSSPATYCRLWVTVKICFCRLFTCPELNFSCEWLDCVYADKCYRSLIAFRSVHNWSTFVRCGISEFNNKYISIHFRIGFCLRGPVLPSSNSKTYWANV